MLALVPEATNAGAGRRRDTVSAIVQRASHAMKSPVLAGIGGAGTTPTAIATARWEAEQSLAVIAEGEPSARAVEVVAVDDVRNAVVMRRVRHLVGADVRCHTPHLDLLRHHDTLHHTDHVATLGAWFDAFGDVASAARSLDVHPNTLRYRLKRIVDLLGVDLADPRHPVHDRAAVEDPMSDPLVLPPDHPVERQLAAYNAHDLDAFVDAYTPTVRLFNGDGTVRAEGREQFREIYVPVFAQAGRRAEILNRIAVGNWVVDHERVHRDGAEPFEAVVAYRLADDAIDEATCSTAEGPSSTACGGSGTVRPWLISSTTPPRPSSSPVPRPAWVTRPRGCCSTPARRCTPSTSSTCTCPSPRHTGATSATPRPSTPRPPPCRRRSTC